MSSQFAFGVKPNISIPRNKFDLSHGHKTTMNVGDLVPILVQEVYPGESFKDKTAFVARSSTPFIRPVIDNLFMDIFYFFVPNRLVYDKWKNVMGENTSGYWANEETFNVPVGELISVGTGSIADHFGLPIGDKPTGAPTIEINLLPFRAYGLIWNEWYRDQNTQEPIFINTGEKAEFENINTVGNNFANEDGYYMDGLAKVNKLHDYFTSALPSPQKGDAVEVPIQGISPVLTSDEDIFTSGTHFPINFRETGNNHIPNGGEYLNLHPVTRGGEIYKASLGQADVGVGLGNDYSLYPSNLYTDYGDASLFVNDLRYAFQIQKMLERDARSGTRYVEYIASHFNTTSLDQTQQRPEFLGGKRMPLQVTQVSQTSQSSEESPLGQVGAFSLSNGVCGFSKSFTEHGFIIGLACIRYHHTYQQGVEKFWTRKTRLDYYDPVFANIGEQPILKKELFAYDLSNDSVFGFQEAWADLRYRPSKVTGMLSSASQEGLDIWHFADKYSNSPILNSEFLQENRAFVQRTLSANQIDDFIVDIYHNLSAIRPMPLYSIPGLIDHH